MPMLEEQKMHPKTAPPLSLVDKGGARKQTVAKQRGKELVQGRHNEGSDNLNQRQHQSIVPFRSVPFRSVPFVVCCLPVNE